MSELRNKDFQVKVTSNSGEVIFDDTVTSLDNGFFEIWLPRGLEDAKINVKYQGKAVTANISTIPNERTCLTTPLKLM